MKNWVSGNKIAITNEETLGLKNAIFEISYTTNSVKLKVSVIKSLFSYAWKVDYLDVNPAKVIPTPSGVDARHERFIEPLEVRRLIAAAREGRARRRRTFGERCLLSLIKDGADPSKGEIEADTNKACSGCGNLKGNL
jgi:integrase